MADKKKSSNPSSGLKRGFLTLASRPREPKDPRAKDIQLPTRSRFGIFLFSDDIDHETLKKGGVDIVTIHGLNGDYESTWTHEETKNLWLHGLSRERGIPAGTRVFSFGYDSLVKISLSRATRDDFAVSLLGFLKSVRREVLPTVILTTTRSMLIST